MKRFLFVVLFCLFSSISYSSNIPDAAVVTETTGTLSTLNTVKHFSGMLRYEMDWVSSNEGNVTFTIGPLYGTIKQIQFIPDSGGTQPTDNYAFTLLDADSSVDAFTTEGSNLSNSTATQVPSLVVDGDVTDSGEPFCFDGGNYTLTGTNTGDSNGGTINILCSPVY